MDVFSWKDSSSFSDFNSPVILSDPALSISMTDFLSMHVSFSFGNSIVYVYLFFFLCMCLFLSVIVSCMFILFCLSMHVSFSFSNSIVYVYLFFCLVSLFSPFVRLSRCGMWWLSFSLSNKCLSFCIFECLCLLFSFVRYASFY